jgi:hypothetical protein
MPLARLEVRRKSEIQDNKTKAEISARDLPFKSLERTARIAALFKKRSSRIIETVF